MTWPEHLFRGYAAVWDHPHLPDASGSRLVIPRGSLRLPAGGISLNAGHDQSRSAFAATADGSLELRDDAFGLTAEFTPVASRNGLNLTRDLARGSYDGLSLTLSIYASAIETRDDFRVEVVQDAEIIELSVVTFPLCQHARLWPTSADPEDLPPLLRWLALRWVEGDWAAVVVVASERVRRRP